VFYPLKYLSYQTMKILIIEDDRDLSLAMSEFLELQGEVCDFAYNGASGITLATQDQYDCVILDYMLPKVNGIDVCRTLRGSGVQTPILMLTACDIDSDQLEGFKAGLDDYVTKPCPMPILWARLQAIYRRNNPERESITIGDLVLFPKEHRVIRSGQELKLTPTSWKILAFLARKSPNVVAKSDIENHLWPDDDDVDDGRFNVHLHQLRKTIDKPFSNTLIHTHVGIGLSLDGEKK
jgi:DNA-binding response OmpR family regulator